MQNGRAARQGEGLPATAALDVRLLGKFRLSYGGEERTAAFSPRLQALLAFIILHGESPLARDTIAFHFWPDVPEKNARNNLRQLLYRLRKALPEEGRFLVTEGGTVRWRAEAPATVDVHRFKAALAAAETAAALEQALAHYRGPLLRGHYEEWILAERERLERLYREGLERLATMLDAAGEYERAAAQLRRLLAVAPLRETTYTRLMRLHARLRDRAGVERVYQECGAVLEEELGVAPSPALQEAYERLLQVAVSSRDQIRLPPQATPLIGREQALLEVAERLRDPDCRLLTIVGPGGIGKTRLAVAAGEALALDFRDGATFVPLAGLSSADYLATTVGDAVGCPFHGSGEEAQQLVDYLRRRELLLVLDNYEHLLPDVRLLVRILKQAPAIKLLLTSRQQLGLRQEWLLQPGGLAGTPAPDMEEWEPPAVRLFLYHSRRLAPDFQPNEQDLLAISQFCDAVGGLPLAIELAAAAGVGIAPHQMRSGPSLPLDLLAHAARDGADRHRSIRATFDHSWQRLAPPDQDLLATLAVFPSSFTPDAATVVAAPAGERGRKHLQALSTLVQRSLLQRSQSGRYQWHPLLRAYAAEKLSAQPGHERAARQRHARFYADLIEERLQDSGFDARFLEGMRREIENVRKAWETGVESGDHVLLGRLAMGLAHYYQSRDRPGEGIRLLRPALAALRQAEAGECGASLERQRVLGRLLIWSSSLHWHGPLDQNLQPAEEAVALLEQLEAPRDYAAALFFRASSYRAAARVHEAIADLETAIPLLEAREEWSLLMWALRLAGECHFMAGDVAAAERLAQRALAIYRRLGSDGRGLLLLRDLGRYATAQGAYTRAQAWLEEAVETARREQRPRRVGHAMTDLLHLLLAQEAYAQAATYLKAAREELGDVTRRFPDLQIDLLIVEGFLASSRGQVAQARAHAYRALSLSCGLSHTVRGAHLLALVGRLLLEDAPARAAELLSFVRTRPVGLPPIADIEPLLDHLREHLPPEIVTAAAVKGEALHIDEVVNRLLVELKAWQRPPRARGAIAHPDRFS